MAKVLIRHPGRPGSRVSAAIRRLRQRARDFRAELARLEEENDLLAAEAGEQSDSGPQPGTHIDRQQEAVAASQGKDI